MSQELAEMHKRELTELEMAQAHKIAELMADNNRLRDSVVEIQKSFTAMMEQEAQRVDIARIRKHWRYTAAIAAMQGMFSTDTNWIVDRISNEDSFFALLASLAVKQADALLKELEARDE